MTAAATIRIKDQPFVVLPKDEYEQLMARAAGQALPAYPPAAKDGSRPAMEFIRVSIAREIITRRLAAGWTQEQLAKRAKVSTETISRLESAKHKPQSATVEKIEAVFAKAGV